MLCPLAVAQSAPHLIRHWLHTRQLQIGMNSAVAAQLFTPKRKVTQLADHDHTAKQKKSLYSGTAAHILHNNNHENIINNVIL